MNDTFSNSVFISSYKENPADSCEEKRKSRALKKHLDLDPPLSLLQLNSLPVLLQNHGSN